MSYVVHGGQANSENGTCAITFSPVQGRAWTITTISVTTNTQAGSVGAGVFLNGRFICATSNGNGDTADGSPLPVTQGSTVSIVFTTSVPGLEYSAAASIIADEVNV